MISVSFKSPLRLNMEQCRIPPWIKEKINLFMQFQPRYKCAEKQLASVETGYISGMAHRHMEQETSDTFDVRVAHVMAMLTLTSYVLETLTVIYSAETLHLWSSKKFTWTNSQETYPILSNALCSLHTLVCKDPLCLDKVTMPTTLVSQSHHFILYLTLIVSK